MWYSIFITSWIAYQDVFKQLGSKMLMIIQFRYLD